MVVLEWELSEVELGSFDGASESDESSEELCVDRVVVSLGLSFSGSVLVVLVAFSECDKVADIVADDESFIEMSLENSDVGMGLLSFGSSECGTLVPATVCVLIRVDVPLGASSAIDLQKSVALSFKIGIVTSYPLTQSIIV